jgi:hypothetical protein
LLSYSSIGWCWLLEDEADEPKPKLEKKLDVLLCELAVLLLEVEIIEAVDVPLARGGRCLTGVRDCKEYE